MIVEMSVDPVNSVKLALWLNLMAFTGIFLVRIEVGGIYSVLFLEGFLSRSRVIMSINWRSGICLCLWLGCI